MSYRVTVTANFENLRDAIAFEEHTEETFSDDNEGSYQAECQFVNEDGSTRLMSQEEISEQVASEEKRDQEAEEV